MEEQDSLPPAPGAGAATDDAGVTEAAPSGLGKRGLKRLQREEMWREKKAAAAAARAEKRAAQEQARAQREAVAPPTEEELAAAEQRREERIAKRKEGREAFVKLCGEGARIVIDCGWDADLSDKELKSLTQQLMHLYSSNKKAAAPSTVVLTE